MEQGLVRARGHQRLLLVLVALASSALVVALGVAVARGWGPLLTADDHVLRSGNALASGQPWLVFLLKVLSRLTIPAVYYVLVAGMALVLGLQRRPINGVFLIICSACGLRLAPALKQVVERPRPTPPDPVASAGGLSFPSGHAAGITVMVLVTLVIAIPVLDRRRRITAAGVGVVLVLLVGLARIILGVHYVSDVLAGTLLGVAWVAICTAVGLLWLRAENSRQGRSPSLSLTCRRGEPKPTR